MVVAVSGFRPIRQRALQRGEPETENSPVNCFPGERPAMDGRAGYGSMDGCVHPLWTGEIDAADRTRYAYIPGSRGQAAGRMSPKSAELV